MKKKCVGVFLVKIFGRERRSERRNENIIVPGTLKIGNEKSVRIKNSPTYREFSMHEEKKMRFNK
jgi:hypothetical protein